MTNHDASKVLMGSTKSNVKEVSNHKGVIEAGVICRLTSANALTIAKASGPFPLGISLGKDLSDTGDTSICRKGLKVPLKLTAEFSPVIGTAVHISDTTGLGIASGAGATITNAVYASGVLDGIAEDGSTVRVALIDFAGGL